MQSKRYNSGEVATILTLGTLLFLAVTAVISPLMINTKRTTSSKAAEVTCPPGGSSSSNYIFSGASSCICEKCLLKNGYCQNSTATIADCCKNSANETKSPSSWKANCESGGGAKPTSTSATGKPSAGCPSVGDKTAEYAWQTFGKCICTNCKEDKNGKCVSDTTKINNSYCCESGKYSSACETSGANCGREGEECCNDSPKCQNNIVCDTKINKCLAPTPIKTPTSTPKPGTGGGGGGVTGAPTAVPTGIGPTCMPSATDCSTACGASGCNGPCSTNPISVMGTKSANSYTIYGGANCHMGSSYTVYAKSINDAKPPQSLCTSSYCKGTAKAGGNICSTKTLVTLGQDYDSSAICSSDCRIEYPGYASYQCFLEEKTYTCCGSTSKTTPSPLTHEQICSTKGSTFLYSYSSGIGCAGDCTSENEAYGRQGYKTFSCEEDPSVNAADKKRICCGKKGSSVSTLTQTPTQTPNQICVSNGYIKGFRNSTNSCIIGTNCRPIDFGDTNINDARCFDKVCCGRKIANTPVPDQQSCTMHYCKDICGAGYTGNPGTVVYQGNFNKDWYPNENLCITRNYWYQGRLVSGLCNCTTPTITPKPSNYIDTLPKISCNSPNDHCFDSASNTSCPSDYMSEPFGSCLIGKSYTGICCKKGYNIGNCIEIPRNYISYAHCKAEGNNVVEVKKSADKAYCCSP